MTLKGNLREFSFIQLLNLINLAKKTGGLYVEGPSDTARVIFREGKIASVESTRDHSTLLTCIAASEYITPSQSQLLTGRLAGQTEKEIGIYLVNAGYLNQGEIFTVIENHLAGLVRKLFTWAEGFFRFEPGEMTPDDKIPVRLDLEDLIIEGSRKLHEIDELKAEIPSLEMALKFTDRPGTNIRNLNLSVNEWRVISYVNPKNTLSNIAKTTNMDELEIRQVVYALLQAGLVEIIRPSGASMLPVGRMFPTQNADEQKTLVRRLIDRIRSI